MNHSNGLLDVLAAAAASAPELKNDQIGIAQVGAIGRDAMAFSNQERDYNEIVKRGIDYEKIRRHHPHRRSKESDSHRKRKKSSSIFNSTKIPNHIHVNAEEQHDQKYIRFSSGLTNSDSESSLAGKKYSPDKSGKEHHNQQQTSSIVIKSGHQENNRNYVDRSQEVDTLPATHLTMLNRSPSFIVKLYAMLSQPELSDIITWLPHGRSWTIIDPIELEVAVIPTYMGNRMSLISFMKRVTTWGFERTAIDDEETTENDQNRIRRHQHRKSYWHEYFLQGKPHLLKKMAPLEKAASMVTGKIKKRSTGKQHHGAAKDNNNIVPSSPKNVSEADLSKISERFPLLSIPNLEENDDSAMAIKLIVQFIIEHGPTARVPVSLFRRLKKEGNVIKSNIAAESVSIEAKRKLSNGDAVLAKRAKASRSSDIDIVLAVDACAAASCSNLTNKAPVCTPREKQATPTTPYVISNGRSSPTAVYNNLKGGNNVTMPHVSTSNNATSFLGSTNNISINSQPQRNDAMMSLPTNENNCQKQNSFPSGAFALNRIQYQLAQTADRTNLFQMNAIPLTLQDTSNSSNDFVPSLASLSTRNAYGCNDICQTLPAPMYGTNQSQYEDSIRNIMQVSFVAGIILGANEVSNGNRNNCAIAVSSGASCTTTSATSSGGSNASR